MRNVSETFEWNSEMRARRFWSTDGSDNTKHINYTTQKVNIIFRGLTKGSTNVAEVAKIEIQFEGNERNFTSEFLIIDNSSLP